MGQQRDRYSFTSESVSEGHPDKVCDRISDEVLDLYLAADPNARVACEVMAAPDRLIIAGEFRSAVPVSQEQIVNTAREAIRQIGYDQPRFHADHIRVDCFLNQQSAHIAQGVDASSNKAEGAGDQGIMFGYASNETADLMPAPLYYSHRILKHLAELRHSGNMPQLLPDAKSQVTFRYVNGKPTAVERIVVSSQHRSNITTPELRELLKPAIASCFEEGLLSDQTSWYINPTGNFEIGGPEADCGLTGRKIIVDTYGGAAPHGGGAFSGKDPTKVDRSAAYMCRYLAKNVVAAGLADRCVIQISYAIGVSEPLSFYVDLCGTGYVDSALLETVLQDMVDLTPYGIRTALSLSRPIYKDTAAYGHFGRQYDASSGKFSWESLNLVEQLRSTFQLGKLESIKSEKAVAFS